MKELGLGMLLAMLFSGVIDVDWLTAKQARGGGHSAPDSGQVQAMDGTDPFPPKP